ncbi:MAG: hypothetical protein ABIG84_08155 [archaeon]
MNRKKSILDDIFLHDKPVKILIGLKADNSRSYASTLAKTADCTYSHTVKILEYFKKIGLVAFEKKGRVKYIKLTKLGEDIASDLENICRKFSKVDLAEKK